VTGGGNGIGRALALGLAQRGARVAIWDIDSAALDETVRLIQKAVPLPPQSVGGADGGGDSVVEVHAAKVDLASRESITAAAQALQAKAGFVWCVINNAGVVSGLPFLSIPPERIEQSFRVNVLAHVWLLQALLPAMLRERRGHIVTVASAAGLFGAPMMADYCASKFAAVGLHESLRLELKKLGQGEQVRTTLVCPAHVQTRLFDGYKPGMLQRSLMPSELAHATISAVERGEELVLAPWAVSLAFFLRGCLPVGVEDHLKKFTGLSNSMDNWKGRNGS
jgi:all-trans-retinol dehydrogenase (NAD+)